MVDSQQGVKEALTGRGIHFSYGDVPVLKDVSFSSEVGRLTIIVGANGCGKSTLLSILARVNSPQEGHVYLGDRDVHRTNTKAIAKEIALLPQGPIAPEGLTVQELVAQGRFPHQSLFRQWTTQDELAIQHAMEKTNVAEFADRLVESLSGGQRQRCWIAMVLAQQTDVLLFDEPTTFLDLKVQVDLMNILHSLAHDEQRSVVVVLHELNLAAAYADQLVMMKSGEIVAQGAPNDVFTSANLKQVFDLSAEVVEVGESRTLMCVPDKFPSSTPVSQTANCVTAAELA